MKAIKSRINTVKNISKVTNTMYMVSAARMKKAIEFFGKSQLYSQELKKILQQLKCY